jgi:hypothetical protein
MIFIGLYHFDWVNNQRLFSRLHSIFAINDEESQELTIVESNRPVQFIESGDER